MVFDDQHPAIWFLNQHLARGHQNPEIGDCRLRRETKSLPKLLFKRALNRVELAVLRAAARSHQTVADAIHLDPGEGLLNHRLLAGIERLCGHIDSGHTDAREEPEQEAVGELRILVEFGHFLCDRPGPIDFERQYRARAAIWKLRHM